GEYLYFVSDRIGGEGGLDIWRSQKINGEWAPAKNLGKKVNTPDDEISPFYLPEFRRLYFSSSWHFGYGGQDIHFIDRDAKGQLMNVINAGLPLNSSANDLYFNINGDGKGFLSSNREGSSPWSKGTCCNDIYQFSSEMDEPRKDTLPVIADISDLEKYLPISLYFHNDEPNPKTLDTSTTLDYLATWENYRSLIPAYRKEYASGLSEEEKNTAEKNIMGFFDSTAFSGVQKLELVTQLLLKQLEKGERIELAIKGYASPLAKGDYNKNLTLRRIQSLINHFENYGDGVFKKYIQDVSPIGGYLNFVKIPFGETKANEKVSDNVNDQRNSVYSRAAALERKIEILAIEKSNKELVIPDVEEEVKLDFENEIAELGRFKRGKLINHTFEFLNDTKSPVKIDHVQAACGCTVVDFPKEIFTPGKKGIIPVEINTKELQKGKNQKSILIIANDGEIIQELKLEFVVY
ncbi:MAG: DUF1573 domain-containing protein, partial [Bacteroidota bacterium]